MPPPTMHPAVFAFLSEFAAVGKKAIASAVDSVLEDLHDGAATVAVRAKKGRKKVAEYKKRRRTPENEDG